MPENKSAIYSPRPVNLHAVIFWWMLAIEGLLGVLFLFHAFYS